MTLLQNDNILNQETLTGKDDFRAIPKLTNIAADFEISRGPFTARFIVESSATQTVNWRQHLKLCPVFGGIQEYYGMAPAEWDMKATTDGKFYFVNPADKKMYWLRSSTPPSFNHGPIIPEYMPEGWVRQWTATNPLLPKYGIGGVPRKPVDSFDTLATKSSR
ncbi:hypothetical protein GGR57DRAFT_106125 [Xylariaceae sp. FL1272]|nr:hypothetical protein GGR57DRAFT_106125 [Xylariaceae sp. FL1272]